MGTATSNLTILFTDIKGFTEKTSHKTRADIIALLEKHKELVLPVLTTRGGRLVKTIGDAFLMTFESPTDAVLAGVAVQDSLRSYNEDKEPADRIEVRIAINSGEVTLADNDVFGDPVNIASRIEGVAEAGEVFFTEAVYLAMNKNEVPSSEIGLLQLKGIPEKVRVYKVRREHPLGQNAAAGRSQPLGARQPEPKAVRVPPSSMSDGAAASGRPGPLRKRALALLIDLVFVGFLLHLFFPAGHSHRHESAGAQTRAAITQALATAAKAAASGTIKMDEHGLKIDSNIAKVTLSDDGVIVNQGPEHKLRIDKDGMHVEGPKNGKVEIEAKLDDDDDQGGRRWAWAWPLVWYLYCVIFLKRLNTTPGGKIMKIHLERTDGEPLQSKDRSYRAAFPIISAYCLGIGYLWALFDKERRGWHDLMACTRVVDGC